MSWRTLRAACTAAGCTTASCSCCSRILVLTSSQLHRQHCLEACSPAQRKGPRLPGLVWNERPDCDWHLHAQFTGTLPILGNFQHSAGTRSRQWGNAPRLNSVYAGLGSWPCSAIASSSRPHQVGEQQRTLLEPSCDRIAQGTESAAHREDGSVES